MHECKKNILVALTAILLLGATPAFAQLLGTWEGTGTGNCYPHPGVVIYPWSVWKGEVYVSPDQEAPIFEGEWYDELGNCGTFKGDVEWPSITIPICKGRWYWYDPTGAAIPVYGGDFEMKFYLAASDPPRCEGTWTSIWPSPGLLGTMEGKKVD